jgi:hypothetical protein
MFAFGEKKLRNQSKIGVAITTWSWPIPTWVTVLPRKMRVDATRVNVMSASGKESEKWAVGRTNRPAADDVASVAMEKPVD